MPILENWPRISAGPSAEIRAGHQIAARCGAWDIAPSGEMRSDVPSDKWSFLCQTDERDTFWLENASKFTLIATDHAGRTLTFRNLTRIFTDEKLGAWGDGPPEVKE